MSLTGSRLGRAPHPPPPDETTLAPLAGQAPAHRRRHRWAAAVLLTVLTAVALSACTVTSLVSTETALVNDGFSRVRVAPHDDGGDGTVTVTVHVDGTPAAADVNQVARVVWSHLHNRFDALDITVTGSGPSDHAGFTFAQLQARFGARNPAWNRTTLVSGLKGFGLAIIIAVLLVAALVVVTVVLSRRARRRRRPPPLGPQPGWGTPAAPGPPPGPTSGWQQYEPPADRR